MKTMIEKWSRNTGVALLLFGLFMCFMLLYAIVTEAQSTVTNGFLGTIGWTLGIGLVFLSVGKNQHMSAVNPLGYLTALSVISVMTVLGAIPFVQIGAMPWIDALLESASGLTTTGLSTWYNFELYPNALEFWRNQLQIIGAIFVLVYFIRVIYINEDRFWKGEIGLWNKLRLPKHLPNVYKVILGFAAILIGLIGIQTGVLILSGASLLQAFMHSVSTISGGGFYNSGTHWASLNGVSENWVMYTTLVFMGLSGVSYIVYTKYLMRDFSRSSGTTSLGYYLKWILAGAVLLFVLDPLKMGTGFFKHLFHAISVVSGSGFGLRDMNLEYFTPAMLMVLTLMGLVGGAIGGLSGGIKIDRLVLVVKNIGVEIKKIVSPKQMVLAVRYGRRALNDAFINRIMTLVMLWIITGLIGISLLVVTTSLDIGQIGVLAIGALGNSGITTLSPLEIQEISGGGKIVLLGLMILGRIEIVPLLLLLSGQTYKINGGRL